MLTPKNENTYLRRKLMARLLTLFFKGELEEKINFIPLELFPKDSQAVSCCIYKDRALTRYKIMALLGMNIEEDEDETKRIDFFLRKALKREKVESPILTVVDIACNSCDGGRYYVTDMCQGCAARPCEANCHFDAVKVVNGRAVIDQDKCKRCGMCKEVCPYNAISYKPVPCVESCPVDAIRKDEGTGKAKIDFDKCIYCGKCVASCPFGAIMERSQILDIAKGLVSSKKMVALVAPSIAGQFPGTVRQVVSSLRKIGFYKVYEVAYGAEITAENEADELLEKVKNGEQEFLTTSCCPAYTTAVKKHLPDLLKYVSSTPSPMAFTAKKAKEVDAECTSVFIGPCIAKKHEAIDNGDVDYVMNFEELGAFFMALGVEVGEEEGSDFDPPIATSRGRKFPVSGGVAQAVKGYLEDVGVNIESVQVDGLNKKNMAFLKRIDKVRGEAKLVEVMACEGGCVNGPCVISNPKLSVRKVDAYAQEKVGTDER